MKIHSVAGDGECLFNSIAFGILYYKQNRKIPSKVEYKKLAKHLRQTCVNFLKRKIMCRDTQYIYSLAATYEDEFNTAPITNEKDSIQYAKLYIQNMSKSEQFGGYIELLGLSNYIHNRRFKGVKVMTKIEDKFDDICDMRTKINSSKSGPMIKILLNNNHFDFITSSNHP